MAMSRKDLLLHNIEKEFTKIVGKEILKIITDPLYGELRIVCQDEFYIFNTNLFISLGSAYAECLNVGTIVTSVKTKWVPKRTLYDDLKFEGISVIIKTKDRKGNFGAYIILMMPAKIPFTSKVLITSSPKLHKSDFDWWIK